LTTAENSLCLHHKHDSYHVTHNYTLLPNNFICVTRLRKRGNVETLGCVGTEMQVYETLPLTL